MNRRELLIGLKLNFFKNKFNKNISIEETIETLRKKDIREIKKLCHIFSLNDFEYLINNFLDKKDKIDLKNLFFKHQLYHLFTIIYID